MTPKQIFNKFILWGPVPFIALWNFLAIKAMLTDGLWAQSMVEGIFYRQPMHSMTILMSTTLYVVLLFYFYTGLEPIIRVGCAWALIVFGLTFYEAWWHLGCYKVWVLSGLSKTGGIPLIWFLYSAILSVCIYYLNFKYHILEFSHMRTFYLCVLLYSFLLGWMGVLESGFYQKFLLYERGLGPNPHDLFMFINVVIGRGFWLPLVRRIKK